tara:strand:- start:27 stop:275 length:249 start_codon:yes stop_codon:yes gene_type:complete
MIVGQVQLALMEPTVVVTIVGLMVNLVVVRIMVTYLVAQVDLVQVVELRAQLAHEVLVVAVLVLKHHLHSEHKIQEQVEQEK